MLLLPLLFYFTHVVLRTNKEHIKPRDLEHHLVDLDLNDIIPIELFDLQVEHPLISRRGDIGLAILTRRAARKLLTLGLDYPCADPLLLLKSECLPHFDLHVLPPFSSASPYK